MRAKAPGFDLRFWNALAIQGWTGLLVPESAGGYGQGFAEMGEVAAATWMMRHSGGKLPITRSNSMGSMVHAVKAGLGIGALPCTVGDLDHDLVRCSECIEEARATSWIVTRRELKDTPRVRAFIDFMAPHLQQEIRKVEERGAIETADRGLLLARQVWRYGVATGRVQRDITADLKGALTHAVSIGAGAQRELHAALQPFALAGDPEMLMGPQPGQHLVTRQLLRSLMRTSTFSRARTWCRP